MKILFDLTPLYDHLTGIERYNANITKRIIEEHTNDNYVLVFKKEVHADFKTIVKMPNVETVILEPCNKFVFIQWRLYKAVKKIDADYYVFLSFTAPVLLRKKGIINAIHDLTCWDVPDTIPLKMRYYYRIAYHYAIKNSKYIITVSEFSKKRIIERYKLSDDKVYVVYDGLSDNFKESVKKETEEIKNKYHLPDEFYLSLSTIEPRKNLQLLIQAYQELLDENKDIPDLVLAGRMGWQLEQVIGGLKEETRNKIIFTGFVDDDDLPALYSMAALFIFPSRYEGFGLPVIEAMSQGTLVLCSDAASLPEVVGDGAVMFKSDDKESLKNKLLHISQMLSDEKKNIKDRAKVICEKYDWNLEAEKLYGKLNEF